MARSSSTRPLARISSGVSGSNATSVRNHCRTSRPIGSAGRQLPTDPATQSRNSPSALAAAAAAAFSLAASSWPARAASAVMAAFT